MRLSWLGTPLTNATVEAFVLKPGEDLGDLLATHPQKVKTSTAVTAGSPGHQKYLYLLKNDAGFVGKLKLRQQELTLGHQSNGNYSAAYNPGGVSGVYQVYYRVSASDPKFGNIQRLAVQSVYVRFATLDLAKSAVKTLVQGNVVQITFRPKTTIGRLIGPAQANAFKVSGKGVKLTRIVDHQDGSYMMILTAASGPSTPIVVDLLGETIYKGPVSRFGARLATGPIVAPLQKPLPGPIETQPLKR
jgi:hypothetical protein